MRIKDSAVLRKNTERIAREAYAAGGRELDDGTLDRYLSVFDRIEKPDDYSSLIESIESDGGGKASRVSASDIEAVAGGSRDV